VAIELDLDDIAWVQLSFVDVFGASNSVRIPAARIEHAVSRGIPFDGSALEGSARHLESDMLLRPDPETLVDLGDGVARAICTVHTPDGARWAADPRYALEHIIDETADGDMTVAVELEFYLLDETCQPLDHAGYFDEVESAGTTLVRAAAERLVGFGVELDAWHHEAGPGQYELDLAPLRPVEIADALVLTKQIVRDLARSAGARATFMPLPFADQPGSGLHLHLHLPTPIVEAGGALGSRGQGFVAGQLAHARAVCAIAAPTVNSYKRLHGGPEAPSDVVWARMNRGALVRVNSFHGSEVSIEYRGADPATNPYLLLTALIAAGTDGGERALELPPAAEETAGGYDPASSEQRVEPLPRSLDDALDALMADDVVVDAFDDRLLARLVDGRRAEARAYGAHVTQWERDRYLDEA
jgi:glutamine synthetase